MGNRERNAINWITYDYQRTKLGCNNGVIYYLLRRVKEEFGFEKSVRFGMCALMMLRYHQHWTYYNWIGIDDWLVRLMLNHCGVKRDSNPYIGARNMEEVTNKSVLHYWVKPKKRCLFLCLCGCLCGYE